MRTMDCESGLDWKYYIVCAFDNCYNVKQYILPMAMHGTAGVCQVRVMCT